MSSSLPLTLYPDPFLRKRTKEISPEEIESLQGFFDDMIETMEKEDGIGLAAPQVGKPHRVFVVAHKDGPLVLINPELTKKSFRKEIAEEGCLSIPKVYGRVKRHVRLTYQGLDRNGKPLRGVAEGLFARVLQHELDHLNGVLFIDRAVEITHGTVPPEK